MAQGIAYNMEMMGKFRYFCQKVLPAVYDDSLSYYELLNKVVEYLNNTIEVVNYNSETIKEMVDYLNQQNIEEMVAAMVAEIMEDMKESGELADIINETIFDELNEKIEYIFDRTITFKGWEGWDVTTDENTYTASKLIEKTFNDNDWSHNDYYYLNFKSVNPLPVKQLHLAGTTDRRMFIGAINSHKHYGFDGYVYTITNPENSDNKTVYIRILEHGSRYTLPETCNLPYNASSGAAIVNCAKSYYNAMLNGREFAYGKNFFYTSSDNIVNDGNGKGRMECDSFVGLCLRGIDYEHSPYIITTPNFTYAYNDMYIDVSDASEWVGGTNYIIDDVVIYNNEYYICTIANNDETFSSLNFKQIWPINTSGYFENINNTLHPANEYLHRDIRFAGDYGIMGLEEDTIFTDKSIINGEEVSLHLAQSGDIAIWRRADGKPISFGGSKTSPGFDNISHCGILSIEDGEAYIYHVSDAAHTFGHIVDRIAIRDLSDAKYNPPDYFVRACYANPEE